MQLSMGKRGITLIELLVVVLIVAILAGISVPVYTNYLIRARRADGKTALEQVRASQEMRRAERGVYSASLVELQTTWGGPATTVGYYTIALNMGAGNTTYTATATPTPGTKQASDGALTINQDGVKAPADKWAK